jgi:hypothetical protein
MKKFNRSNYHNRILAREFITANPSLFEPGNVFQYDANGLNRAIVEFDIPTSTGTPVETAKAYKREFEFPKLTVQCAINDVLSEMGRTIKSTSHTKFRVLPLSQVPKAATNHSARSISQARTASNLISGYSRTLGRFVRPSDRDLI